jgi:hypothetical protein
MAIDIAAAAQLYGTGDVWASCVCAALICLPIFIFCIYEAVLVTAIKHTCSYHRAFMILIQLLFCPIVALLR